MRGRIRSTCVRPFHSMQINVRRLSRLLRHPISAVFSHMLTDYSSLAHGCLLPMPKLVGKRFDELYAYFPRENAVCGVRVGWWLVGAGSGGGIQSAWSHWASDCRGAAGCCRLPGDRTDEPRAGDVRAQPSPHPACGARRPAGDAPAWHENVRACACLPVSLCRKWHAAGGGNAPAEQWQQQQKLMLPRFACDRLSP